MFRRERLPFYISTLSVVVFVIAVNHIVFSNTIKIASLYEPEYESYFNRGRVYYELKNPSKGIIFLDSCISYQPFYAPAYLYKGLSYAKIGKYNEAIRYFEKTLKLNPYSMKALEMLGKLWARKGRPDLSEMYLRQLEELKGKR